MSPLFQSHLLNDQGFAKAKAIGASFDALVTSLEAAWAGGDPRCISIVKTNLEQACFFAKKAIAVIPENQKET